MQILTKHIRVSKLGKEHSYTRTLTVVVLRCDSCGEIFERPKSKIETKRLSNHYFHCCADCDNKRFAQRKGIERKQIWDKPASITADISKL